MRLASCIAYGVNYTLGAAYNRIMETVPSDGWMAFLDHDAMFTTEGWRDQLRAAIAENDNPGLFAAMTNRIGRKTQIAPGCPQGHQLEDHRVFGEKLLKEHGGCGRDITNQRSPLSGVVMCISRRGWEKMEGFHDGFFGVDNWAHRDMKKTGLRVYLLPGLYVYHVYRADGVGHPKGTPRAT